MNPSERFVVYPCLVLLAALSFMRQGTQPAPPGEATFRKVTILDEQGRRVVVLDGAARYAPVVVLGPKGRMGIDLGFDDAGGGLVWTFGPDGEPLVKLSATDGGGGSLDTFGPDGKERVSLGVLEKGGGGVIKVMGPTGKPHVDLEAREDGGIVLTSKPSGAITWTSTPP